MDDWTNGERWSHTHEDDRFWESLKPKSDDLIGLVLGGFLVLVMLAAGLL